MLSGGVLLDADRPDELDEEALRRATDVLDHGLLGETDADLDAEFAAYWTPTDLMTLLPYCDAEGPARQILISDVAGGSKLIDNSVMVAEFVEDVERWAKHMGATVGRFTQDSRAWEFARNETVAVPLAVIATGLAMTRFQRRGRGSSVVDEGNYPRYMLNSGRFIASVHRLGVRLIAGPAICTRIRKRWPWTISRDHHIAIVLDAVHKLGTT